MKDYLNQNTNALLEEFWKFSKETEKMIEDMCSPMNIHLPIDIWGLAEKLGFNIVYEDMSNMDKKNFGLIAQKTIYVNKKISYKEQRWVIAKAVALFLNGYNTEKGFFTGEQFFLIGNPFFISRFADESYLDFMATLLLVPINFFKREIDEKIKLFEHYQNFGEQKITPDSFDSTIFINALNDYNFLQALSDAFQIPIFQFSIGYHFIKQMLCFQRQKEFEKVNYDVELFPFDEYENIFL